jgi:hypothetical protein
MLQVEAVLQVRRKLHAAVVVQEGKRHCRQ